MRQTRETASLDARGKTIPAQPDERQAAARDVNPIKALRVMVVEDDAMVAMMLSEVLMAMGHEVCAIEASEAEAVGTALRCRPDLMIVDARLREGSGISAVEEIRRSGFVPHLFVAGDALSVRAVRPNAIVVQKPFCEAELIQAMQRALDPAIAF
jgi:CheY-like chemotaxis protein